MHARDLRRAASPRSASRRSRPGVTCRTSRRPKRAALGPDRVGHPPLRP
jgi:hypothetical protein